MDVCECDYVLLSVSIGTKPSQAKPSEGIWPKIRGFWTNIHIEIDNMSSMDVSHFNENEDSTHAKNDTEYEFRPTKRITTPTTTTKEEEEEEGEMTTTTLYQKDVVRAHELHRMWWKRLCSSNEIECKIWYNYRKKTKTFFFFVDDNNNQRK